MSKREVFLVITILSIVGAAYPYVYSHWPTKTEWQPILQTSSINSSTELPYPWTLFNATPSFESGAEIEINVTYGSYSCFYAGGCAVSPEICLYTVTSFEQINYLKALDQQAIGCGGSQSYTYNNITSQYVITFQTTLPASSEYDFISRLVTSCGTYEYECPQYGPPSLLISQPSSVNPLQQFGDPQLISLVATISAVLFGALTVNEHKEHH
jgi:hypothetical protein